MGRWRLHNTFSILTIFPIFLGWNPSKFRFLWEIIISKYLFCSKTPSIMMLIIGFFNEFYILWWRDPVKNTKTRKSSNTKKTFFPKSTLNGRRESFIEGSVFLRSHGNFTGWLAGEWKLCYDILESWQNVNVLFLSTIVMSLSVFWLGFYESDDDNLACIACQERCAVGSRDDNSNSNP